LFASKHFLLLRLTEIGLRRQKNTSKSVILAIIDALLHRPIKALVESDGFFLFFSVPYEKIT